MMRSTYTIALEILPTAPVTHGQGNNGNEQELCRQIVMMSRQDPMTGKHMTTREEIPYVSGASLRAKLRLNSLLRMVERMGIPDGSMSKDALRLILKGGKLDGAGRGPNLDEVRRMTEMFPMLRLFGSMDNRLKLTGALKVEDIRPFCAETLTAGIVPRTVRDHIVWGGDPNDANWPKFDFPPSFVDITSTRTYYKHDMGTSPAVPLLEVAARAQIADQQMIVAAKKAEKGALKPDKEERREANESMPHAFQHIIPGTPLYSMLRTDPITDIEAAALVDGLNRWIETGAHIGGCEAKGHGRCRVRAIGTWVRSAGDSAISGTAISLPDRWKQVDAQYSAHLQSQKDAVLAFLRESW